MTFHGRIAALERERAHFAIATVVGRRSPVSSHLGDRALIFADGHMEGFVGGSCSRDIVRRQALEAIRSRQPLLLQIRPDAEPGAGDERRPNDPFTERILVPMSCSSEGAVDVYIEPRVPRRRLVVAGFTPVAESLAAAAEVLEYDVVRVVADVELSDLRSADRPVIELGALRAFLAALAQPEQRSLVAIVASQGHYDELALEILLDYEVAFIGLLASRRRAANVFGVLEQQGVALSRIATVRNPVGLDINARSAGEVAISIVAEIIARESPTAHARDVDAAASGRSAGAAAGAAGAVDVDPMCGMDVETATALYRYDHEGRTFFFCGAGCRASFIADPHRAATQLGAS